MLKDAMEEERDALVQKLHARRQERDNTQSLMKQHGTSSQEMTAFRKAFDLLDQDKAVATPNPPPTQS